MPIKHITCVLLVALDSKLQILSCMWTLNSQGWHEWAFDTVILAWVDQ